MCVCAYSTVIDQTILHTCLLLLLAQERIKSVGRSTLLQYIDLDQLDVEFGGEYIRDTFYLDPELPRPALTEDGFELRNG